MSENLSKGVLRRFCALGDVWYWQCIKNASMGFFEAFKRH
jgi:hypothetical protein